MTTTKVSDAVRSKAADLKPLMGVENGQITAPDDLYAKTLTGDITLDVVKAVQEDRSEFLAAATLAAGELAEQAFMDNSELKNISFEVAMGHDRAKTGFSRDGEKLEVLSSYHATDIKDNIQAVQTHLTTHFAKLCKG